MKSIYAALLAICVSNASAHTTEVVTTTELTRDNLRVFHRDNPRIGKYYTIMHVNIGVQPLGTVVRVNGNLRLTNDVHKVNRRAKLVGMTGLVAFEERFGGRVSHGERIRLGGRNITAYMHHDHRAFNWTFVVTKATRRAKWVKLLARAYTSHIRDSSRHRLPVDGGSLQVIIEQPH